MPIIAVNVAPTVFSEIRSLVDRGLYASPEQFLEIAAFNQVALERGAKVEEVSTRSGSGSPPEARRKKRSDEGRRPEAVAVRQTKPKAVTLEALQTVLGRVRQSGAQSHPIVRPDHPRPENERIWGQVNRLFPLKLVCRWVLVASAGKKRWENLDGLAGPMGEDASVIGSFLDHLDGKAGRKRDELLATGLPRQGNLASRDRFLSQFVARTTRAGEIYPGAVCQYALADFDGDRLALTQRGEQLAALENPILDGDIRTATATLSAVEAEFLVRQVREMVPGELQDCSLVLSAVVSGQVTPDSLFSAVRPGLPQDWSDLMARTHLSGLVARMADMGLLRRRWDGRNVQYEATAGAVSFTGKELEK